MKSPLELVRAAAGMRMVDPDGGEDTLQLLPPLSDVELEALRRTLPCPLPRSIEDLLRFARGFANGPLESTDFSGLPGGFGMEEVFPHALPIAHDGYGNFWVADLTAQATDWGPIFFACHDPAVIAWQCRSLAEFIGEFLAFANPPHTSALDDVHEGVVTRIWRDNPGAQRIAALHADADPTLREFLGTLDDTYMVVDLREPRMGDGFSWGRYGPRTVVRRHGEHRLFAYQRRTSWVRRLLGHSH